MENIVQADALLFGRVTYEMMEAAWRLSTRTVAMPEWTEPFARTIDAAKKYVVSSTLDRVDWNAEFIRGKLPPLKELARDFTRGGARRWLRQRPGRLLGIGRPTIRRRFAMGRRHHTLWACLAVTVALGSLAHAQGGDSESILKAREAALAARDVAGVLALFADDAVVVQDGKIKFFNTTFSPESWTKLEAARKKN